MMNIDEVVKAIKTISAANGYAFFPSAVDTKPNPRNQSVCVVAGDEKPQITINATGRCLARIRDAIVEKCGTNVEFTNDEPKPLENG